MQILTFLFLSIIANTVVVGYLHFNFNLKLGLPRC